MGTGVLDHIKSQRNINVTRKVVRSAKGLEALDSLEVQMGADQHHLYSVECRVDSEVPKNEIVLGFRALVKLGYRFTVCGLEGRQRKKVSVKETQRPEGRLRYRDDDEISFLDESEARRIEEWRD